MPNRREPGEGEAEKKEGQGAENWAKVLCISQPLLPVWLYPEAAPEPQVVREGKKRWSEQAGWNTWQERREKVDGKQDLCE